MKIRKIKETEISALIDLYSHYVNEENVPKLSELTVREIWDEIAKNPCINYFVLEMNNTIVSSCILSITPSFIRGGKAYGVIEHVVVHSDFRRRGLAKSILNFALDYAWKNECTEVMLMSGSNNAVAHQLYRNLG